MKKMTLMIFVLCAAGLTSRAQKTNTNGLQGKWVFVSSSEKDLGEIQVNNLPNLVFDEPAKNVSGSTGCNSLKGSFIKEGDQLTFGQMVTTKKACTDMKIENYLTQFFTDVGSYRVDSNKLFLYRKTDKSKYVVFKK